MTVKFQWEEGMHSESYVPMPLDVTSRILEWLEDAQPDTRKKSTAPLDAPFSDLNKSRNSSSGPSREPTEDDLLRQLNRLHRIVMAQSCATPQTKDALPLLSPVVPIIAREVPRPLVTDDQGDNSELKLDELPAEAATAEREGDVSDEGGRSASPGAVEQQELPPAEAVLSVSIDAPDESLPAPRPLQARPPPIDASGRKRTSSRRLSRIKCKANVRQQQRRQQLEGPGCSVISIIRKEGVQQQAQQLEALREAAKSHQHSAQAAEVAPVAVEPCASQWLSEWAAQYRVGRETGPQSATPVGSPCLDSCALTFNPAQRALNTAALQELQKRKTERDFIRMFPHLKPSRRDVSVAFPPDKPRLPAAVLLAISDFPPERVLAVAEQLGIVAPERFLDAVTEDLSTAPVVLPNGVLVDAETLALLRNESPSTVLLHFPNAPIAVVVHALACASSNLRVNENMQRHVREWLGSITSALKSSLVDPSAGGPLTNPPDAPTPATDKKVEDSSVSTAFAEGVKLLSAKKTWPTFTRDRKIVEMAQKEWSALDGHVATLTEARGAYHEYVMELRTLVAWCTHCHQQMAKDSKRRIAAPLTATDDFAFGAAMLPNVREEINAVSEELRVIENRILPDIAEAISARKVVVNEFNTEAAAYNAELRGLQERELTKRIVSYRSAYSLMVHALAGRVSARQCSGAFTSFMYFAGIEKLSLILPSAKELRQRFLAKLRQLQDENAQQLGDVEAIPLGETPSETDAKFVFIETDEALSNDMAALELLRTPTVEPVGAVVRAAVPPAKRPSLQHRNSSAASRSYASPLSAPAAWWTASLQKGCGHHSGAPPVVIVRRFTNITAQYLRQRKLTREHCTEERQLPTSASAIVVKPPQPDRQWRALHPSAPVPWWHTRPLPKRKV